MSRSFLLLVTVALALASSPHATQARQGDAEATGKLLEMTMDRFAPMDSARARELLAQGADVHGRNSGGATPFILAVETFAYQSASPALAANLPLTRALIDVLAEAGSDISAQDGRGVGAFAYLLTYSNPEKSKELLQALLARVPDLGVAGHDDGFTFAMALAISRAPYQWLVDEVLARQEPLRLDLRARSVHGYSVLHFAAFRRLAEGAVPRIKQIADAMDPLTLAAYADAPDGNGAAPLAWATAGSNLPALRYLAENFPVDLNRISTDGETPLDVAVRIGWNVGAEYLRGRGAIPAPVASGIVCDQPNAPPLSFAKLTDILRTCRQQVQSLEGLLPLLPRSLRGNHVLMHASRGLQGGSLDFPRAILFERDAGIFLAFNGDASQPNYQKLEVLHWDPAKRDIELREVDFADAATGGVRISDANPARCVSCHTSSPRAHWESWTAWSGAYFGDMLNLYSPLEKAAWNRFQAARPEHPRYKHLLPTSMLPQEQPWGTTSGFLVSVVTHNFGNTRMDSAVDSITGRKIARELAQSALRPYRYALLGALSCAVDPGRFLPEGHVLPHARTLAELEADLRARALAHAEDLESFQQSVIPGGMRGRYTNENFYDPKPNGRSLDLERMARLRYLVEGLRGDGAIAHWSTFFNGRANYVAFTLGNVEAVAWRELLDPTEDAWLHSAFSTRMRALAGAGNIFSVFEGSDDETAVRVCEELRTRSLAALGR